MRPPVDLKGKPVLITGASSGIGAATAIACAQAGMPVVLTARRQGKLDAVAKHIESLGGQALAHPCDVTDPEAVRAAVAACVDRFGAVYAAFANAGYGFERRALDADDAAWRDIFETNFFGTLHTVRAAVDAMTADREGEPFRGGHLLICSSCLSNLPVPRYAAYCATKAAQKHLGRALRIELQDRDIAVSTVHPVGTRTEFFDTAQQNTAELGGAVRLLDRTKSATMQPPERVARAVVRCLRRPRPEVWTSCAFRLASALTAISPRLTDAALRLQYRKRMARPAGERAD